MSKGTKSMAGGAGLIIVLFVGLLVMASTLDSKVHAADYKPDPSPRFEYLGSEYHGGGPASSPAYIHVFVDKAMHQEVICFSGDGRSTLSCYPSGRIR